MTLALDRMRELWEFSPMSASQIGAEMGVTKNVVIGQAHRKGWQKFGQRHPKASAKVLPTTTVFTRCDATPRHDGPLTDAERLENLRAALGYSGA